MILDRRHFVAACAASTLLRNLATVADSDFRFNYLLGSCMYGDTKLEEIVPEVATTGATAIDIWPKVHGNQREQLDEMGETAFRNLLAKHSVSLGCITQYKLGPFGLRDEMRLAQRLGCHTMVSGGRGPNGLKGSELKAAVGQFIEQMKPHLAIAEETDVTIAIENHGNNIIDSPDSLKWLVELCPSKHLGIALAPYHLDQDPLLIAQLVKSLGNRIAVFYAWQHGMGCMKKLPKEQELLQMPGRGDLDFAPIVDALISINYSGWTEIFMHPVPRGVPILETVSEVTDEINRSRNYIERVAAGKRPELEIPRIWKPVHKQNGRIVSATVRVVGVIQEPFPDPKTGKQIFQCVARVLRFDSRPQVQLPSPVCVDLLSPTLLRKDTTYRVTGELSISESQIKGGTHPATLRVISSNVVKRPNKK